MDRYKVRGNGKKMRLCKGKNDTCMKEPKQGGLCKGCTTGFDKTQFQGRVEGELFTDGRGIRYKYIGNQSRQLCNGDNNTCESVRKDATNLCQGHQTGFKKYGTEGLEKGDIVERNGEIRVFNGIQLVQICSEEGCDVVITKDGKCKKHSQHWHCKFADTQCTSIRIEGTEYCAIHKNGIQNPREKSKSEKIIADWLDSKNINYTNNPAVAYKGRTMYPDFILTDLNAAIEFDGMQHFKEVDYWGGHDGLVKRVADDVRKDQWAKEHTTGLLRLSFADIDCINDYLETFIELIHTRDIENKIVSSDYNGYAGRNYIII